jgi:TolB-like protein/Tfp pilus assembly protein PilF
MDSLLNELRRRNVLRLAATYALVAWILIEAGSVLLPTFGVPDWFFRAYVLVIFAGFVAALVLAWVFEVTPEGVKFERQIDRSKETPRGRGKSNSIIIALLAVALGVSITFNVTGIRDQEPPAAAVISDLSRTIAVLPFTSRSADPDNQFFADGMHDDLLTRLAEIESLRVISRTSVSEYRDTTKNLRQIGTELGAATIVEGAVQRSGDQVRITVQLIDAASDQHIWAENYDSALTTRNVFDVQSEISAQIASALKAALTPEEVIRLAVMPTQSIEALSLCSAARNNLYLRRFDTLQEARRQFERAIELDPEYAQAYAGLAETVLVTATNHASIDPDEAREIASAAVAKALELDDQLAEAYAVQGLLEHGNWEMTKTGDRYAAAATAFQRAIDLNPNLASAYVWFASLREAEGAFEDAIQLLTRAMQIDPLGRIPYINLPGFYSQQGENEKAVQLLLKAMDIFPDWPSPYVYMSMHLKGLGRFDEAVAWNELASTMTDDPMISRETVGVFIEFGDTKRIDAFVSQFTAEHPIYPIGKSYAKFMDNDYEGAITVFDDLGQVSEMQANIVYPILALSALRLKDYDRARDYLIKANPLLASDTKINVDRYNLRSAILLAYILRQTDRDRQASDLLSQAWDITQQMPRLGIAGHGISDVHILAIQGRKEAALDALREAIDDGFVSLLAHDFWTIDQDILIDNLRNEPRYQAMRAELQSTIDGMWQNVQQADESGDWSELLNRVRGQLTAAVAVN